MSDIKIPVDFLSENRIKLIKNLENGAEKILFFLQILCIAGQANDGGNLIISHGVPHTIDSLAACTGRDKQFVEEALETFSQLNMVALSNEVYTICDWQDYQIVDQVKKKKEQDRKRAKAYYYRKKDANNSHVRSHVSLTLVSREVSREKNVEASDQSKRQAVDSLKKAKEQARARVRRYRERKKLIECNAASEADVTLQKRYGNVTCNVTCNAKEKKETERKEKTEKKNQEKNKENREIEKNKENLSSPFIPHAPVTLHDDVFSLYEKVIQPLIPYIGEKLVDLIQELGEEKVKRGIEIAAEKGVRNFNYIATVARNINKPAGNRDNWDDAYKQLTADLDSKSNDNKSPEKGRWLN